MTAKPAAAPNPPPARKRPPASTAAPPYAPSYAPGAHTGSVRAFHDNRRTELLARDEVLASEIAQREAERHDIGEALRLMSDPGPANVVPMRHNAESAA